jgi:ankyrin repeat protein
MFKKIFFLNFIVVVLLNSASQIPKKTLTQQELIQLYDSTCHDDDKTVITLLQKGMSPTAPFHCGYTPLHRAAQYNSCKVLRHLIKYLDGDIDTYIMGEVGTVIHAGLTPLHLAALHGHTQAMKILLEAGANKNKPMLDSPLIERKFSHPK